MKIRFIRRGGRVIPIIDRGSQGPLGSVAKMRHHDERIEALKTVRNSLTRGNRITPDRSGEVKFLYPSKHKMMKVMQPRPYLLKKLPKDRLKAEVTLNKMGLAPKTFLIQTTKKDYMVQGKIAPSRTKFIFRNGQTKTGEVMDAMEKVQKKGLILHDIHADNFGYTRGRLQIFDAGGSKFEKVGSGPLADLNNARASLRAKKYHIKMK